MQQPRVLMNNQVKPQAKEFVILSASVMVLRLPHFHANLSVNV
jgi:hypothetical protein